MGKKRERKGLPSSLGQGLGMTKADDPSPKLPRPLSPSDLPSLICSSPSPPSPTTSCNDSSAKTSKLTHPLRNQSQKLPLCLLKRVLTFLSQLPTYQSSSRVCSGIFLVLSSCASNDPKPPASDVVGSE